MNGMITSSTVSFEVDSSSGQLGGRLPKELAEGSQRAESLDFYRWGARADILSLSHGRFQGKPASLISFEFRFQFNEGESSGRFSEAKIITTFRNIPNGTKDNDEAPIVKLFGPKLINGPVTVGQHRDESVYSGTIGGGDKLPVKPEIRMSKTCGVGYLKDYKMQITGKRWSDPDLENDNMVIWTLLENSKQGEGIPHDFRAAVIVQHSGKPFQGTIKISTRTKWGLKLFGWPWSNPNPLLYSPNVAFGEDFGLIDFESLEESHWARLCDISEIFSSFRLTEKLPLREHEGQ